MDIDEVIAELLRVKKEHGNIQVRVPPNNDEYGPIPMKLDCIIIKEASVWSGEKHLLLEG